jgi:MFS family permease
LSATILFLVTGLMVPIAGFLGDRWSRKWIITASLLFWSVATALTGTVKGLMGIIVFRSIATGGGEAFYGPSSTALIAAFHQKTRAIALSIHQGALYVGIMSSGFLAVWIAELSGSWRVVFYVFGAAGFLLGISFIFLLRPEKEIRSNNATDSIPEQTNATVENIDEPKLSAWAAVKCIVKIPTALLLTVGFTAIVFVNNAYLTWAPTFIHAKFDNPLTEAAGFSMLYHFSAALLGILIGGTIADTMVPKFPRFRLCLQTTAMFLGVPLIFCFGWLDSIAMVWVVTFIFGFVRGLYESNTHAAMFDVIPAHLRSTVVGLMLMVAFLIGSQSPWLLGLLGKHYGTAQGLAYGFSLLSIAWIIGGFCILMALLFTFKKDRPKG